LGVVGALVVGAACDSGGVRNDGATGSLPVPKPPASTATGVPVGGFGTGQPSAPVDVWSPDGLAQALDAIEATVGDELQMTSVVLYAEYVFAEVRFPPRPADVDRYLFRDGVVMGPTPSPQPPGTDLDAVTFARADVAWAELPRMLRSARRRIAVDQGTVSHVIVEHDPVFANGALVVRVYVGTIRRAGYVEFDADGRFRRVVA
jgi:hypothetical protein